MSIFESYQQGSCRGVPFLFIDSDADLGRRSVVYEYPGRDLPMVEDLGRRARTWRMEIMAAGPDYMAWRDRLITALETAGPAVLEHPTLGRITVAVIDARGPRESTRQGGTARFFVVFVEAGQDKYPSDAAEARSKVTAAAAAVDAAATDQLERLLDLSGPAYVAADAAEQVADFAGDVRRAVTSLPGVAAASDVMGMIDDLTTGAADLVRAPVDLYQSLQEIYESLIAAVERPSDALSALRDFWQYPGTGDTIPLTTTNRQAQASNRTQMLLALNVSATSAAAQAASAAEYDSQADADAARVALMDRIDGLCPDAEASLYDALENLRAIVCEDLGNRPGLPGLVTVTLAQDTPALVLAHRLYNDAARDTDIVARNRIAHPGFVPGGRALEVLDA